MEDIKAKTKQWADAIGYHVAVGRLVSRGMSPRAAERLCSGRYNSSPKSLRVILHEEIAKDEPLLPTQNKAS